MIQVDIGGHPPIPFEPPPSILSVFQFWHNLLLLAIFWVLNSLSRFEAQNGLFWKNREKHAWTHVAPGFSKKCRLGPQNGSRNSGPEKLLKIVSGAETEKLKELMVGVQME